MLDIPPDRRTAVVEPESSAAGLDSVSQHTAHTRVGMALLMPVLSGSSIDEAVRWIGLAEPCTS